MKTPLRVDAERMAYPRQIIDKGKQIIAAGTATDQAYFLISGRARASNPLIAEGELQSGDFLSFLSFLALDAYDADVIAASQAEVLILPRGLVEQCWQDEDQTSWVFACSLAVDVVKRKLALDTVAA
jgi:CRP-like cAMP-binding protein